VGAFTFKKCSCYCVSLLNSTQFQSCDLKTYRKNYKSDIVKKIWVFKRLGTGKRLQYILTLRDRLLQMIIDAAVHPILEYQSDPHSFAYRPNRSAIDAIALVVNRLEYLQKKKINSRYSQLKILKSLDEKPKQSKVTKMLSVHTLSHFIINIDIHKCLDSIDHNIIMTVYPLCDKYRYFLKAWLKSPIYGLLFEGSKNLIKWIPKHGVPQGSVIGPSIVNCVLDGFEKVAMGLLQFHRYFKSWSFSQQSELAKKSIINLAKNLRMSTRFFFVRFASDILILGEGTLAVFNIVLKVLTQKLKEKGLILQDTDKPIIEFKPKICFDYLGFRFSCKGFKKEKLIFGRLAFKNYRDSLRIIHREVFVKNIGGFVLSIQPESFRKCCARIRELLTRSNSGLPVDQLLKWYNYNLRSVVNYFGVTINTRNQLRYLDNLSHCWFRRLLLQKYSSVPKVNRFVHWLYYTKDWRVSWSQEKQLKTLDVKPFGNMLVGSICLPKNVLKANLYIDLVELDKTWAKSLVLQEILRDYRIFFKSFATINVQSENYEFF
jgi:retron-type reverse transcriptase